MSEQFLIGCTITLLCLTLLSFVFCLVRALQLRIKTFLFLWFVGSVLLVLTIAWPYALGMPLQEGNDLLGSELGKAVSAFYLVMAMGGLLGVPPLLFGILVFGFFLAGSRVVLNTLY
jgi:hypothetical protein